MTIYPQYHDSLESLNQTRAEKGNLPIPSENICPICQDSLLGQRIVTHDGDGEKHPFHESCLKKWLRGHETCPVDKLPYDRTSIFSWKERTLIAITPENRLKQRHLIMNTSVFLLMMCVFFYR